MSPADLRKAFPILERKIHGKPLVYLDNGATTPKPLSVLDAMDHYNRMGTANIHRGIHTLAEEATASYEGARDSVARLIGSATRENVIFTKGTTEGLNLIARTWGDESLMAGDEIILSVMEHHANLVPWQMLAKRKGLVLKFIPILPDGQLDLSSLDKNLTDKTRLVSVTWVSNVLGTVNPVAEIIRMVRAESGARVILDAAQAAGHQPLDVDKTGADAVVFSGHKTFGPTGVGVLWARKDWLDTWPPFLGGGDMIKEVRLEGSTWNDLPHRFEAGTPAIAEVIGLGAAAGHLMTVGWNVIAERERILTRTALSALSDFPDLKLLGNAPHRAPVFAFTLDGTHPSDVAAILDTEGIAVRSGTHCAEPLHRHFGLTASARASFSYYNTEEEVGALIKGLHKVRKLSGRA